jgi:hypothetical protein
VFVAIEWLTAVSFLDVASVAVASTVAVGVASVAVASTVAVGVAFVAVLVVVGHVCHAYVRFVRSSHFHSFFSFFCS